MSFIIPNLNSGILLEQTIISIISKEYKFNYEVIIVDGLSIDGSVNFLQNSKYNYIYTAKGKDINVYDAMNKGISLSKGEWLMFLGAGDTLADSFLKLNLNLYSQFKLIYGNVFWVSKGLIYDGSFILKKLFYKNICQQSIIYNRKCFNNSMLFNINYFINADYEFNLNLFIDYFNDIKYIDELLCNYKGDGISHYQSDLFNFIKNRFIIQKLLFSKSFTHKIILFQHIMILSFNKIFKFIRSF